MNFRQVGIVFRKELTDSIRDKRTIISTVVVPLLLFPVLFLAFGAMANHSWKKTQGETSAIMILGAENGQALVEKIRKAEGFRILEAETNYSSRIAEKRLRAALEIPAGFETNNQPLKILHYAGEVRSQMAVRNLQKIIREHRDHLVAQKLASSGLSKEDLTPFETKEENVAPPEKVGGNMIGGFIPYMIILLSFVGAMAPAVDLTAGEKERGTIETILASPVGRTELVMGKFLLVCAASMVTTLIALISNVLTFFLPFVLAKQVSRGGAIPFDLSGAGVVGVFILALPLAVMFAAGQLAICSFARNYREAHSYVSPLTMVVLLPGMGALLPGFDLDWRMALVPVLNVSLAAKDVLSGNFEWGIIVLVFASSCAYAAAALAGAVAAFKAESALFRA